MLVHALLSSAPLRRLLAHLVVSVALLALSAGSARAADVDLEMWGQPRCPHCQAAHAWLDGLRARRPDLRVVEHDVTSDPEALLALRALADQAGLDAIGLPTFRVRGELLVGFESAETTGRSLEERLDGEPAGPPATGPSHAVGEEEARGRDAGPAPDPGGEVRVPWLGPVDARRLGLPLFTLAIGLVDGFNPCATWVLVFLLALLVNVKSRSRMAAIAGTFVAVSGLAYFAFMAAWLNVFQLDGLSRAVQVVLGLVALVVGVVNIKDFFAFERGLSFSIPASAKPGIYARVRSIVRAESLGAALAGAAVLAVFVNVIELVCTAGLPAVYTGVLVQHHVGGAARYGYLGLYMLAYVLDDAVLVAIAVATLSRRKLQERAGRWLKLLSGVTIAALGGTLLLAPQALVW